MISLTEDNISEWLTELDAKMLDQFGIADYSKTFTHAQWLAEFEWSTTDAAIDNYKRDEHEDIRKAEN